MRIVLDTNSLIIALSSKNKYGVVWKAFLEGRYTLCVSNEILEEYVEVIGRNLSPTLADMVAYAILLHKNVERIDPHFRFGLITADADDNKFVDCAKTANAKCVVTNDVHFQVLKEVPLPKVYVVDIDVFMRIISNIE